MDYYVLHYENYLNQLKYLPILFYKYILYPHLHRFRFLLSKSSQKKTESLKLVLCPLFFPTRLFSRNNSQESFEVPPQAKPRTAREALLASIFEVPPQAKPRTARETLLSAFLYTKNQVIIAVTT